MLRNAQDTPSDCTTVLRVVPAKFACPPACTVQAITHPFWLHQSCVLDSQVPPIEASLWLLQKRCCLLSNFRVLKSHKYPRLLTVRHGHTHFAKLFKCRLDRFLVYPYCRPTISKKDVPRRFNGFWLYEQPFHRGIDPSALPVKLGWPLPGPGPDRAPRQAGF